MCWKKQWIIFQPITALIYGLRQVRFCIIDMKQMTDTDEMTNMSPIQQTAPSSFSSDYLYLASPSRIDFAMLS